MDAFEVHPQLLNDCELLGDLALCRVLLMRDSRFPWLVLVPRRSGLRDLHDLENESRNLLFNEIELASIAVEALIDADKVNVAALGNQVPQLHIHVIGRREDDAAWPKPVWCVGSAIAYEASDLRDTVQTLSLTLALQGGD